MNEDRTEAVLGYIVGGIFFAVGFFVGLMAGMAV